MAIQWPNSWLIPPSYIVCRGIKFSAFRYSACLIVHLYYKNQSWVSIRGHQEDHRLASRGLLSDDKGSSWGTDFSISPSHNILSRSPFNIASSGTKLVQNFREKWLLPAGQLGRSDSQIGRSYSANYDIFCQFRSKSAITHAIAI